MQFGHVKYVNRMWHMELKAVESDIAKALTIPKIFNTYHLNNINWMHVHENLRLIRPPSLELISTNPYMHVWLYPVFIMGSVP